MRIFYNFTSKSSKVLNKNSFIFLSADKSSTSRTCHDSNIPYTQTHAIIHLLFFSLIPLNYIISSKGKLIVSRQDKLGNYLIIYQFSLHYSIPKHVRVWLWNCERMYVYKALIITFSSILFRCIQLKHEIQGKKTKRAQKVKLKLEGEKWSHYNVSKIYTYLFIQVEVI